jgi:hypothetical protein
MWFLPLAGALIAGTVTLTDATGAVFAAPGVRVTLTCAAAAEPGVAISDDAGAFRFADVATGSCSMTTDLQGFVAEVAQTTVHDDETASIALHLVTAPVRTGVVVAGVVAKPSAVRACRRKECTNTCER